VGAAVPAAISFTFSVETTSHRSESGSHILIERGASAQYESQSRKWIFVCADYLARGFSCMATPDRRRLILHPPRTPAEGTFHEFYGPAHRCVHRKVG
jgi:hypothetical protein